MTKVVLMFLCFRLVRTDHFGDCITEVDYVQLLCIRIYICNASLFILKWWGKDLLFLWKLFSWLIKMTWHSFGKGYRLILLISFSSFSFISFDIDINQHPIVYSSSFCGFYLQFVCNCNVVILVSSSMFGMKFSWKININYSWLYIIVIDECELHVVYIVKQKYNYHKTNKQF